MCPVLLEPTCVARVDEAFWNAFTAQHWGRGPVHFRFADSPLAITNADLFGAMVAASAAYVEGEAGVGLTVYVNGHRRMCDFDPLLPTRADTTLDEYAARTQAALPHDDFTLVVFGCHQYSVPIWRAAREFLAPLLGRVGLQGGYIDVDVFSGRYARTPFGIHKDYAANFSFVVAGEKSMLFWPDETFRNRTPGQAGNIGRSDYESFTDLDGAVRIDARAGDVIYWPASFWHIAMSEGSAADTVCPVTMNLALHEQHAGFTRIGEATAHLLGRHSVLPRSSGDSAGLTTGELQAAVADQLGAFVAATVAGDLERRVRDDWLRFVSGGGFRKVPKVPPMPALRSDDRVSLSAGSRVLWQVEGDRLKVAVNGSLYRFPCAPGLTTTLATLARGDTVAVGTPEAEAGGLTDDGRLPRAQVERLRMELLQKLRNRDALQLAASPLGAECELPTDARAVVTAATLL